MKRYEHLQGDYQISTTVNGEPSWKNGAYAIWFMSSSTKWIIGPLHSIGEDFAWIFGKPSKDLGLTNIYNRWSFWNGSSSIRSLDTEDIQITCNGKYSKHLQSVLFYRKYF